MPGMLHHTPSRRTSAFLSAAAVAVILVGLAGCSRLPPLPPPAVRVEPAPVAPPAPAPAAPGVDARRLARIDSVVQQEGALGHIPGAVVLVGHDGRIGYRQAFGKCWVEPRPQPMRV